LKRRPFATRSSDQARRKPAHLDRPPRVPHQIPARLVPEMRKHCVDASLNHGIRRRILDLVTLFLHRPVLADGDVRVDLAIAWNRVFRGYVIKDIENGGRRTDEAENGPEDSQGSLSMIPQSIRQAPLRDARSSFERRVLAGITAAIGVALVVYSQTAAFAWDEGFHLLTAQLIAHGRRVYLDFMFPQTPLNAWWNAILFRVFGYTNWRAVHAAAAIEIAAAVWLAADYVLARFPVERWRLPAAIVTAALIGLNVVVFEFGPIGQAYAWCLVCVVAAFRLALTAVDRRSSLAAAACGLFACTAPLASLLAAPFAAIFLAWVFRNSPAGKLRNAAAFCVGGLLAFAPLAWLFRLAPHLVKFNVLDFNMSYRRVLWPGNEQLRHDAGVALLWIDSSHALILLTLFAAGIWAVRRENVALAWTRDLNLCAVCAAVEGVYLLTARPTFGRYFLLTVPFFAIPGSFGLYWFAGRLSPAGKRWPPVATVLVLLSLGLGRMLFENESHSWSDLEDLARKVNQVSPPGTRIYADEQIYFLLDRTPPPGMEHSNSHKLTMQGSEAERLHVISSGQLDSQLRAGAFGTYETCDDDEVERLDAGKLFRHEEEVSECSVFWQPVKSAQ
jgi:hypothetical protein